MVQGRFAGSPRVKLPAHPKEDSPVPAIAPVVENSHADGQGY
jgi:hypothetical protein